MCSILEALLSHGHRASLARESILCQWLVNYGPTIWTTRKTNLFSTPLHSTWASAKWQRFKLCHNLSIFMDPHKVVPPPLGFLHKLWELPGLFHRMLLVHIRLRGPSSSWQSDPFLFTQKSVLWARIWLGGQSGPNSRRSSLLDSQLSSSSCTALLLRIIWQTLQQSWVVCVCRTVYLIAIA